MSSTSRSPDGKAEPAGEPEKKKLGSPGRYSLADADDDVPSTRIDSTNAPRLSQTSMPAQVPSERGGALAGGGATPAGSISASRAAIAREPDADPSGTKKPAISLPTGTPLVPHFTNRGMPAPPAKGAAPVGPPSNPRPNVPAPAKPPPRLPDAGQAAATRPAHAQDKAAATRPTHAQDDAAPTPKLSSRPPAARPPSIAPPPGAGRRISSLRPPPPPRPSSIPPPTPLALDGFDEGSIAFAFDALVSGGGGGHPGTHEFDLQPVRELFAELAANHMRHVRDFMIDVKWGDVTRDWVHICVPPVRTLQKAAERLELGELGTALKTLGDALDLADASGGQMLDAEEKERLLDAYGLLVTLLPQAFGLERDKTQREAVIVQALLLQVPDVRKVTIDKLAFAGLTSLTELFAANAHDIAHVAGIQDTLAAKIVERVQAYRAELKSSSPQDARAAEREKLATLNGQLHDRHSAYEDAANGWGPEAKAKKRDHFLGREETWLEISVLLARFGEVDRLQGIEKVPFSQRIAQLTVYLEEARDKYRSPEG